MDAVERRIHDNLPLARAAAFKVIKKLGRPSMYDDIEAAALVGLWQASRRFDATRGIKFSSYAGQIMHGHMMDWLRDVDHLTRTHRREGNGPELVSLDQLERPRDDRERTFPLAIVEEKESPIDAEQYLKGLLPEERYVLRELYLKGRLQYELAGELGVCFARVSQIAKRAIEWCRYAHEVGQGQAARERGATMVEVEAAG